MILSTQRTFNDLFVALVLCFLAANKPGPRIRNLKTVPNNPQLFEDTSISQPNFYGGYPPPGKIEEQILLFSYRFCRKIAVEWSRVKVSQA